MHQKTGHSSNLASAIELNGAIGSLAVEKADAHLLRFFRQF